MNKFIQIGVIAVSMLVFPKVQAHGSEITTSYSFNQLSASLCLAAKKDQPTKIRTLLREAKDHIRNIYVNVDCAGESLLDVARRYNAAKVADYLSLKTKGLPVGDVKKTEVGR